VDAELATRGDVPASARQVLLEQLRDVARTLGYGEQILHRGLLLDLLLQEPLQELLALVVTRLTRELISARERDVLMSGGELARDRCVQRLDKRSDGTTHLH
jgi:hypothetical protein